MNIIEVLNSLVCERSLIICNCSVRENFFLTGIFSFFLSELWWWNKLLGWNDWSTNNWKLYFQKRAPQAYLIIVTSQHAELRSVTLTPRWCSYHYIKNIFTALWCLEIQSAIVNTKHIELHYLQKYKSFFLLSPTWLYCVCYNAVMLTLMCIIA